MKIAWVTPFSIRSAIGRFSRIVCAELLRRGEQAIVIRCEAGEILEEPAHPFDGTVLDWTVLDADPSWHRSYDIVVYNMGDNYPFHRGALRFLEDLPGVVILHDFFLLNLYLAWRHALNDKIIADRAVDVTYGAGAATRLMGLLHRYADLLEDIARQYPMTEWIARSADGVIAHSRFYSDRLKKACAGPVVVQPLAYAIVGPFTRTTIEPRSSRLTILTVGHVNPNKRVEAVIKAIGSSEMLRSICQYVVAGQIEETERSRLQDVATGLRVDVVFCGQVSDPELVTLYQKADIVSCLRWPILEGASASAIEAMLYGLPVVVTDDGFYAEIPDEFVLKVRHDHESDDLTKHLQRLAENGALRMEIGNRASRWAAATFSARRYVEGLIPFLEEVIEAQPLLRSARQVASTLAEIHVPQHHPCVSRIAGVMEGLFVPGRSS